MIHTVTLKRTPTVTVNSICSTSVWWLMVTEKGYNEKMIGNQILKVQEHSKKDLFGRDKKETPDQNLTINLKG